MYPTSLIRHKSKYSIIFHICDVTYLIAKLLFIMSIIGFVLQSRSSGDTEASALMFGFTVFYFYKVPTGAITSTVSLYQQNEL